MDEMLDEAVAQPRLNMAVVAGFAGIALLLACVGIYGMVSYFVTQRTQEIGVRMALGATRGGISRMFLGRAAQAAAMGLAGGGVAALMLTRLLQSQLYGVSASDPAVYAGAIGVLFALVLIASWIPARRAASVNPVEALRAE
jgi:putative ABC transport system permease protein